MCPSFDSRRVRVNENLLWLEMCFNYSCLFLLSLYLPSLRVIGPAEGEEESFTHQLRGVIPRAFEYLFSLINREQEKVLFLMPWILCLLDGS